MLRRRPRHRHADRARLAAAALAGLALAAAGCGGEPEPATTGFEAEPPTRAEFVAEADAICHSSELRIEAAADDLAAGGRRVSPVEARRAALRIVVPGLEAEVRAIRSLPAPPGDAAEVERILAATERGIAQIEADPESVLDGPPPGLREAGRLARAYGSRECGAR